MKHPLLRRFFAVCLAVAGPLLAQQPARPAATPRAPDPSYAAVADVSGLPRVLLIGDSISMGYTLPVRARFEGRANVHRPAENCSESANGLKRLNAWLGDGKWDVIHFNFGLHDMKYLDAAGKYVTPDKGKQVALLPEYEKNLRELVARLQKSGAKLVFATTTPVPSESSGRVEHDELRYNEAAVRVMKELGVAVDDLHAVVAPQQDKVQLPHNVHFNASGYAQLADAVVASITPLLPPVAK
jgi:lysophospholipase L1-like esterase